MTGTAFIVVANFVMIVLCLCYSHASCAGKNVFPVHTYILLLIRYSFLKMRCFISLLEMNSKFLSFVDHRSCVKANGAKPDDSGDTILCGNKCQEV